ncbi:Acetyltransferase (GNAT) family [Yokenella regensburgei]|nr:Acetyltransferase (GNAT) family [Yokenella regensburgei]
MTEINEYGQEVGTPLPQWQGAEQLRRKTLTGRYCRLETLCAQTHAADLYDAYAQAEDERDWTWLASRRPQSVADTQTWLLLKTADPSLVPFAVIDSRSDRAVGLVCLMAIDRANGTVEIGHVTWSPRMKNSVLGTETVWLLLREAFACGYRRVEWKCDSLNTASRRAAERLGFTFEGVFARRSCVKDVTVTATGSPSLMVNGPSVMRCFRPGWKRIILPQRVNSGARCMTCARL